MKSLVTNMIYEEEENIISSKNCKTKTDVCEYFKKDHIEPINVDKDQPLQQRKVSKNNTIRILRGLMKLMMNYLIGCLFHLG